MWLPLVIAVAAVPAARPAPKPPKSPAVEVAAAAPVAVAPEPAPAPPAPEPAPAPAAVAPAVIAAPPAEVAPAASTARLKPIAIGLDVGVDVPLAQRTPMAAARLDVSTQLALPGPAFATLGVRSGYSFVSGELAVADSVLGVDNHALLMAHRVPVRAAGRLGLRSESLAVGVLASAGADVVSVHAQSFGRLADTLTVVPGASVGGFVTFALGDSAGLGLVGEYDVAAVDLSALTPGVSGDLSAVRVALCLTLSLG